jgi:uncharacterized protein
MKPRLHLVTLGVADLAVARAFYGRLGWQEAPVSNEQVAFFDLGCLALALFPKEELAADARQPLTAKRLSGVALAQNVASSEAVDALLAEAVQAGATLEKPGTPAAWGGYAGYFSDPDGHLWEVAYNPFFPIDEDGYLRLNAASNNEQETPS